MTRSELRDLETLLVQVLPDPVGFGRRVMEQVLERLATDPQRAPTVRVAGGPDPGLHQALLDRSVLLAAALGACDCWGQDLGCPHCSGHGTAGWRPPDPQLYGEYIAPAAARMAPANGIRPHDAPAEPTGGNPHDRMAEQ